MMRADPMDGTSIPPGGTPSPLDCRRVELPTGLLEVTVDQTHFPLDDLLGFAARANAKRGFLFLSKVLGKHWPVTPGAMAALHRFLAEQIKPDLSGPVLFIAMAETAIGLGQGVFEAWLERHPGQPALFLHSSRYRVGQSPTIEFEEAHSHAPRQFLHVPDDPASLHLLRTARTLVLVDDEASTGNTFVNLCRALRERSPDLGFLHLSLITDFMGPSDPQALAARFGLPVTVGAVLSGRYRFAAHAAPPPGPEAQRFDPDAERGASGRFGRLGLRRALAPPDSLAQKLADQIGDREPVLVLGTGEFMHPAFLLARALAACGKQVVVQSTTRSPILNWGAVGHILQFPDNYGEGIANYLYNVAPQQYRHVLVCHETPANPGLRALARQIGGRYFHFESEGQIEEIPVR